MSGRVSSSSGRDAYKAMRQLGRSWNQRSTLSATRSARKARSAGESARRLARNAARKELRAAARLESKGVTRMCRCEPLLSNQSNKWDGLQQVRLSAQGG